MSVNVSGWLCRGEAAYCGLGRWGRVRRVVSKMVDERRTEGGEGKRGTGTEKRKITTGSKPHRPRTLWEVKSQSI